ncbi:hypothetical protein [Streptomyces gilvus]|uniref:hypothetical protein n=1 Tax=Streptomyces gilvus TaxID=2920937 RepID=UPI001F0E86B5|nr:hypothetical protein [Streptomyces sp. CME 23]MCH5672046.1 hypothetical protein [Streptomyces sp. CME 23]
MVSPPDDFRQNHAPGSPRARDHGLRRINRLTRWITVAAVAAAAALGGVYTHLLPGHSAASAPTTSPASQPRTPSATTSTQHGEGDDEGGDDGAAPAPQPPAQPPAATQQQPHTTTGAS